MTICGKKKKNADAQDCSVRILASQQNLGY